VRGLRAWSRTASATFKCQRLATLAQPDSKISGLEAREVESFELWDMNRVIESITGDSQEWKPNVALVIIDMFVRRGLLAPEEVGYVDLVRSLKS